MIPASYLFRDLYRNRFEQDDASAPEHDRPAPSDGEHARLNRVTAAIVGFAFGSPTYVLGTSNPHRRRR